MHFIVCIVEELKLVLFMFTSALISRAILTWVFKPITQA